MKLLNLFITSLLIISCSSAEKDDDKSLVDALESAQQSIKEARDENRKKKFSKKSVRRYRIPKPRSSQNVLSLEIEEIKLNVEK